MKATRRARLVVAASLLAIAAALAAYMRLARQWLSREPAVPQGETHARPSLDPRELPEARRSYREGFFDPRAHLRLSEALRRAGRGEDSFYVAFGARGLFAPEVFTRAHAAVVLGGPSGPAEAPPSNEPLAVVAHYARRAHADPDSYEGRYALQELGRMARRLEEGPGGESSRLAREGLEELLKDRSTHPRIFTTLALALRERGDGAAVGAMIAEALKRDPSHPGAAFLEGALALEARQTEKALRRLSAAWENNPDDPETAMRLAQIHLKERGDAEAALPYYLALYRWDPSFGEGEGAERAIRRTLDERRERNLARVPAEALGAFLRSQDGSLRAQACVRAAELGDPRWLETLGALLDDDAPIVRRNAAYALYRLSQGHPDAVRARRDEWLSATSPLTRAAALALFADLEPKETLPLALAALADPSPVMRGLTKAWTMDRYYKENPDAARAATSYLGSEKDPFVLAFLGRKGGVPQ